MSEGYFCLAHEDAGRHGKLGERLMFDFEGRGGVNGATD